MNQYPHCVRCGRNYVHKDNAAESYYNAQYAQYYIACPRYTPKAPLRTRVTTRILGWILSR